MIKSIFKRVLIFAVAIAFVVNCGSKEEAEQTPEISHEVKQFIGKYVTLDGYDADANLTVENINIWKEYNNRPLGISTTGKHGQKVKLLNKVGDAVEVETEDGKKGWVTYYFIKELK